MANKVFANGREIACKSSTGKSICSFPDVCLSPPSPPAGPVPIPYPNTAFASDTSAGSKSVKLHGKEAMLKDKSFFKKSTGDEAATKSLGMNVVTHQIQGKAYFIAWSMDVKIEGYNVARFQDLTTHNHGSKPAGAPPTLYTALAAASAHSECATDVNAVEDACDPWSTKATCPDEKRINKSRKAMSQAKAKFGKKSPQYTVAITAWIGAYMSYAREIDGNECRRWLRCILFPYNKINKVKCKRQTGEHMIDKATVKDLYATYKPSRAPTSITEGPSYHIATHGLQHAGRYTAQQKMKGTWTLKKAIRVAAVVFQNVYQQSQCNQACIEKQLIAGHAALGVGQADPVDRSDTKSMKGRNRDYGPWSTHQRALAAKEGRKFRPY